MSCPRPARDLEAGETTGGRRVGLCSVVWFEAGWTTFGIWLQEAPEGLEVQGAQGARPALALALDRSCGHGRTQLRRELPPPQPRHEGGLDSHGFSGSAGGVCGGGGVRGPCRRESGLSHAGDMLSESVLQQVGKK